MDDALACASLCTLRPLKWPVTPEVAGSSPVAPFLNVPARAHFRPSSAAVWAFERRVERVATCSAARSAQLIWHVRRGDRAAEFRVLGSIEALRGGRRLAIGG